MCNTHNILFRLAIVFLFSASPLAYRAAGQATEATPQDARDGKKHVLLITGEDYRGHKWRTTTPVLKAQLEKDDRLSVTVCDDLATMKSLDLGRYDAVVMHFKNYDPNVPGRAAYDNLAKFVRDGGGLVLVHFACGAFQERRQRDILERSRPGQRQRDRALFGSSEADHNLRGYGWARCVSKP